MENKVANMRIDYGVNSSFQSTLPSKDPYKWFKLWFQEAVEHPGVGEPNAMSLSTASSDGTPSCRYVLLKGYSDKGFRFFTNYLSQKGQDLTENPKAALTFYWEPLRMQIRINGDVERLSNEESTEYFHSRPFSSQISALVSKQTMVLPKNRCLKDKTCELTEQYKGKIVPKPHYWGGYLVKPHSFEFWCGGSARLHDRIRFRKQGKGEVIDEQLVSMGENGWLYERLSP